MKSVEQEIEELLENIFNLYDFSRWKLNEMKMMLEHNGKVITIGCLGNIQIDGKYLEMGWELKDKARGFFKTIENYNKEKILQKKEKEMEQSSNLLKDFLGIK